MEDLIIRKEEFEQGLEKLINDSELPAFAVRQTLTDCLEQIVLQEKIQLNRAKQMKQEQEQKAELEKIEEK